LEIIVAKSAGFCFGVDKAIRTALDLVENCDNLNVYTLGPIIHNEQVVKKLASKGAKVIDDVEQAATPGHVLIRTHGVTPEIYNKIEECGLGATDATCPYVKKIHTLVKEKHEQGYQIIIVGDRNHPEVEGINGWCGKTAFIVESLEDVERLQYSDKPVCVVAQTTLTNEMWQTINNNLKNKFKNIIKFDTICNATNKRQTEAAEIAKNVDMMFVIGSSKSSNTQKLYAICKANCDQTFKIETSGDLPPVDIKKIKKVGITAGASTPDWIIKEVIEKMEELNKQENEMSFKEAFESSLVTLQTGEIVKGKIIGFNNAEVYVDLGFKSDGIIPIDEFVDDPDFKPEGNLNIGDEVEVFVIRVNDGEGNVLLSKKKVDAMKSWNKIEEAYENKTSVRAKVVEVTKGGVIASTDGIRIFIPASQVSDRYVKDLNEFLKQTLNIRIIEYNKARKKIVGSAKVILAEERSRKEEELWGSIEVGKKYTGIVKSLMDFGAFVDIGGVDGLIHISELSWGKIKHPSEVVNVGDKVEVSVLEFDKDKKRISLGFRKAEDNPWYNAEEKYKVGEIVKGKVVRLVPFGAFVEIGKGVDGLVHISQISNVRIAKPDDVLKVGQEIEAKIVEVNVEARKIGLSIKEVSAIDPVKEGKEEKEADKAGPTEHKEDMPLTLGDIIENAKSSDK
jgi:small subunit ribosomal protein S1